MYIPAAFEQHDPEKLVAFIRQNSFGLLVSQSANELIASHLPFLLDRGGEHGQLIGHFARANPQWRDAGGQNVLAIFSGPHAYISPTWYETEGAVPTWNYVAVHVYGKLHIVEDDEALAKILRDFVAYYEASLPRPWVFDSGAEYAQKMMKAVTGFRIEITRIEGKWKLNQNRPEEQREKVVRALQSSAEESARVIAELMRGDLDANGSPTR